MNNPAHPSAAKNGDAPLDSAQRAALLAAKDELDWTSAQLADHVGVSARTIQGALLGEPVRRPTRSLLALALAGPCVACGAAKSFPRCAACRQELHRGAIDASFLELIIAPGDPPLELTSTTSIFEAGRLAGAELAEPPKRRPIKPGSINGRVLAVMRTAPPSRHWLPIEIQERLRPLRVERVENALSSLKTAGYVVSEPNPAGGRSRLWRLA